MSKPSEALKVVLYSEPNIDTAIQAQQMLQDVYDSLADCRTNRDLMETAGELYDWLVDEE